MTDDDNFRFQQEIKSELYTFETKVQNELNNIKKEIRRLEFQITDPRWSLEKVQQSLIDNAIISCPVSENLRGIEPRRELADLLNKVRERYIKETERLLELEVQEIIHQAQFKINEELHRLEKVVSVVDQKVKDKLKEYDLMP